VPADFAPYRSLLPLNDLVAFDSVELARDCVCHYRTGSGQHGIDPVEAGFFGELRKLTQDNGAL